MKKRLFIALGLLIFLVTLVVVVRLTGLSTFFSLDFIQQQRLVISRWTQQNYIAAVFLYMIAYGLAAALAMPGVALLAIMGGFLFGPVQTTLYTVASGTPGALILFLATRYFFGFLVKKYYQEQLLFLHDHLTHYGILYIFWARLTPIFPFFLTNILAALMPISVGMFVVTTAIGIMPVTFLYAYAGRQLTHIHSLGDVFSLKLVIALGILAALSLLPLLIKKRQSSENNPF